jgi:hypothetical protein
VTVSDGRGHRCTIASLSGGKGACHIAERAGKFVVTATYAGSANYLAASASTDETVK